MRKSRTRLQNNSTPLGTQNHWTGRISKFRDFYEVLENVGWLWRILGLFPIVIKAQNYKKRYGVSVFYAAVGLLTYLILILDFIYVMNEFGTDFRYAPLLTTSTILITSISSLLSISFTNVWRIIKFKEFSKSINDLSAQATILEKSNCRIDYDSSSKIISIYVWTTFLVTIYFMIYDTSLSYQSFGLRIEWSIGMLKLLLQMMDVTILVSLVGCLGLKFRSINNKINSIVTRANTSSPKIIVSSDVCAENLRSLSKFHYDICEIGKGINRYHCVTIIINVTTAFVILSTTLYYIFVEVRCGDKTDTMLIVSYIHMELSYSFPIIVIVLICNWTSNQANYAGKLIHEIRVTEADSQLYDVIKSFSLQLHHQKLEFTGGGLFPLDSSLLQTMAGKITTYLVILIQFQPKIKWGSDDN